VLDAELKRWEAVYTKLWTHLLLENTDRHVHIGVSVDDGSLPLCIP